MPFDADQRRELAAIIQSALSPVERDVNTLRSEMISRCKEVDKMHDDMIRGEGEFKRIKERHEDHVRANHENHAEMRKRIGEAFIKLDDYRPDVEWMAAIRKAFKPILIAGLVSLLTGLSILLMRVYVFFSATTVGQ